MNEIRIDLDGLQEIQAAWAKAPEICREELGAAMSEADLLLEHELKDSPEMRRATAHGQLRGSVFGIERVSDTQVIGIVGTPVNYAVPVELGTKPHFPPIEPLVDWVRQKLDIADEKQARGVAFLIARKISRRGTQGAFMFTHTFEREEAKVQAIFRHARDRIVARLSGAR